jgi:hypothetical protein
MAKRAQRRQSRAQVERRPRPERAERTTRNLAAARLRAHRVKVAFVLTAASIFIATMIFARISYAGHSKHHLSLLNAPNRFVRVVKKNRLQAGVVAPPQASAAVASAPS